MDVFFTYLIYTLLQNWVVLGSDQCQAWEPKLTPQVFSLLGSCYLVSSTDFKLSWEDARKYCDDEGGQLAKVKDDDTDRYLSQVLTSTDQFWLGLSRQDTKDGNGYTWVYTDGEISEFSLLLSPPNYMDTSAQSVYLEVWTDRETCPWYATSTVKEQRRFMCQYAIDVPPGAVFSPIPWVEAEEEVTARPTTSPTTIAKTTSITKQSITSDNTDPGVPPSTQRQVIVRRIMVSTLISLKPIETLRVELATMYAGTCLSTPECSMFNYNPVSGQCRIFAALTTSDSIWENKESWEVWQLMEQT